MGNSMEIPQTIKNRITKVSTYAISGYLSEESEHLAHMHA